MSRGAARPPSAPPPDRAARERATRLFDRNLVVTAGAGTGKTAILVERTLNLVGSGTSTLGRLALITFTDKAAAELRLRLGNGLDRLRRRATGDAGPLDPRQDADRAWDWLATSGVPAAEIGRRALGALSELDAASVGTIHQFCLDLLRRHPREAGIDPRAAAGEAAALDRLLGEAWERHLRGAGGPHAEADAWRAAMARDGSAAAVRDLGEALARFTLPTAALEPYRAPALLEILGPALAATADRLDDLAARVRGTAPKMTRFLALARETIATIRRDGLTPAGAHRLAADLSPYASLPGPGKKIEGVNAEEIDDVAGAAHDLLSGLAGIDEGAVAAAHAVARPFAAAAQRLMLERGFVPFDAMLRLARETLARQPEVRRATRSRYRMLLVDEFQDTDPLQYEVVFFLAGREGDPAPGPHASNGGPGPEADAWSLDLEPGRLFIVGDPKQSIYRFRRADIAAFRRAVSRVLACGGEELRLTASFRSPARLLAPINQVFDGWLGPPDTWRDDHSPPYVKIQAAAGADPPGPPRVQIWSADAGPGSAAEAGRRAEAAAIAGAIAARVGMPRDETGAPWKASDFALLFRATTNVAIYARALEAAGLPCLIEGGRDFAERAEVNDLLSFLRAVANPNDGPALLAVLRSPLGAVPDAELLAFADERSIEALLAGAEPPDAARFPALRRAVDLVARFRERQAGHPADDLLQAALLETPLRLLHAASHDGSQRLANLRAVVARARREAAAGLTLPEILAAVEAAYESTHGPGEGPVADETLDAVRLLSVHKAKGLEFEVVFVPDLGRQDRGRRTEGAAEADWIDAPGAAGRLAVRLADGRTNAARVLFEIETARHEEAEERRVFYVACTRARRELVLVNSRVDRRAAWRDRLAALGYVVDRKAGFPPEGLLAGGLVEHRVVAAAAAPRGATDRFDAAPFAAAASRHARRVCDLARAARPPLAWPSGTRAGDILDDDRPAARASASRRAARLAGIVVHRALESWDFRDGKALRAAAAAALRSTVARETGEATPPAGLAAALTREVRDILDGLLGSPLPERLAKTTVLGREVPILHRDAEGVAWGGACDLIYRDDRGLVVADYKTDRLPDAGGIDEARQALVSTYADQMAVYLDAVAAAYPREALRGELLMLRTGDTVELPRRRA